LVNISVKLEAQLPQGLASLLREIGEIAEARGESAYLVGGVVRDVLLGRSNFDFDVVIKGRAISLARQLARDKGWDIRTHPRFGTAKLLWEDFSLDLVTARSETYDRPGALPTVKAGNIEDDLARRDFTINAMCICLNPRIFGDLLDPHGGQVDLEQKLVRILHHQSFVDDPTRILRALRYEQRLGFQLESETNDLLIKHLTNLDTVTGERLWHELELILEEDLPETIILKANALGILQRLGIPLSNDEGLTECFVTARSVHDQSLSLHSIYLALLAHRMDSEEIEGCITRLKMPGWATRVLRDTLHIMESVPSMEALDILPSEIYRMLKPLIPEVIASAAITSNSPTVQERLEIFLYNWRYVKPEITGTDLQKMGVSPGKQLGEILKALHDARLNQTVTNRDEEEILTRKLL
jgi:tRNA nucleotidyltransferase (CCA-adding enzyme)